MLNFTTLGADRDYLDNKYHRTDEPFNPFARMQYHGYAYDPATGLDDQQMHAGLAALADEHRDAAHAVQKALAFQYVLDNARIDVNPHDYFIGIYNWGRPLNFITCERWHHEVMTHDVSEKSQTFIRENYAAGNTNIWLDYDHSVPDWNALFTLGFPGVLARARAYRAEHAAKAPLTAEQEAYFTAIEIEYSAILRLLDRMYQYAMSHPHEKTTRVAECLRHLRDGAPQTTYDALQLIYLYFIMSESVESFQVRSLGSGLDHDLYPFYRHDIDTGRFSREEIAEFLAYFLTQFSAIGNYWGQPFYMGGTEKDGTAKINEVSYLILDVYEQLKIYNPKIQIKYSRRTPLAFTQRVLDLIRNGQSSFVFVCEDNVTKALVAAGEAYEDAADCDIKGCYEYEARGKGVSTAPLYVNLLRSVNTVLESAKPGDLATYEQFEAAYFQQLQAIFDGGIAAVDEMEQYLAFINPSPLYSATLTHSLETAKDGYFDGSVYNNTAIVVSGLASAVDALMSVRYLVYDSKRTTLAELATALAHNWEGFAPLRQAARNCPYKYGNNEEHANACTERLAAWVAAVQGRKNVRGGVYKVTIHSARQFIDFGEHTGATPDGRRQGEETSKNASPSVGMDTNGATALVLSALKTRPYAFWEGHCLDIMLHPSASKGDEGLAAIKCLLDVYDQQGGASIQFNVLDAATLRQAQLEPETYKNLQVRVCGWNVLFNNMCKAEQDAYIERSLRL